MTPMSPNFFVFDSKPEATYEGGGLGQCHSLGANVRWPTTARRGRPRKGMSQSKHHPSPRSSVVRYSSNPEILTSYGMQSQRNGNHPYSTPDHATGLSNVQVASDQVIRAPISLSGHTSCTTFFGRSRRLPAHNPKVGKRKARQARTVQQCSLSSHTSPSHVQNAGAQTHLMLFPFQCAPTSMNYSTFVRSPFLTYAPLQVPRVFLRSSRLMQLYQMFQLWQSTCITSRLAGA